MQTLEKSEPIDTGAKIGAVFLIGFVLYGGYYVIHYMSVKTKSAYKFTVAEVVDDCNTNSTLGNLFQYKVKEEVFSFCKVDPDLRAMKKGETLLIKFYIDDPSAYDLLLVKVPKGTVAPADGWDNIPTFD